MPRLIAACVSLLIAASLAAQQKPDNAQAEIRKLNAQLIEAYKRADATSLERIFAAEYVFIDEQGLFLPKEHIIESFRSGDHRVFSYDISEGRVHVYGDAAVMTYRYVSRESYKGQRGGGDFRVTRVFARKNGSWQLVASQETRIAKSK